MATRTAPLDEALKNLPRNSVDSAISTASSIPAENPEHVQTSSSEIANLFRSAGGPEPLVQHLLRERTSMYQQNSQLWKAVTEQRAMIVRLNKNAELASQEKEKYKAAFDNLVTNLALFKSPEADGESSTSSLENMARPSWNIPTSMAQHGAPPDLQTYFLGNGVQNDLSSELPIASHLMAPPVDRHDPRSVLDSLLDPGHFLPQPQALPSNKFGQDAVERAQVDKQNDDSWINPSVSLESSQSPHGEPVNVTLPKAPDSMSGPPPYPGFEFNLPGAGLPEFRTDEARTENDDTDSVTEVQEITEHIHVHASVRQDNYQEEQDVIAAETAKEISVLKEGDQWKPEIHTGMLDQPATMDLAGERKSSENLSTTIPGPEKMKLLNASAWVNSQDVTGYMVGHTNDNKKQKKRGLFKIGPNTRDSQDSSVGGSESGSSAAAPRRSTQQIFGMSLDEAARWYSPTRTEITLPSVVYRCIQFLNSKNAIREEGIFRLSGSSSTIKKLRELFNTHGDLNLLAEDLDLPVDTSAVTSLLKLYLRELPELILPRDLQWQFLSIAEFPEGNEKTAALIQLAKKLPHANAILFKHLFSLLTRIINREHVNKMNARNVGIVFLPTLNIPAPVFSMFLQHYETFFGVDAESCELPELPEVPETEALRESFDAPPRPSTASRSDAAPVRHLTTPGRASPHLLTRTDSRDTMESDQTVRRAPVLAQGAPKLRFRCGFGGQLANASRY
ncbi:hypothetical protein CDD83_5924 [Cordyceps sp. RAO-2017]|nr:hypothetical protein CDD83_5924 [Cordyceps sp. RAO-2017]